MPLYEWTDLYAGYTDVQALSYQAPADEWGSPDWQPSGPPIRTLDSKLTSKERFESGHTKTDVVHRLLADLPLDLTEKQRIRHPVEGDMDIVSVVPYPTEGMAAIEVTKTA